MDLMRSIRGNYLVIAFENITKRNLFKMGVCKTIRNTLKEENPFSNLHPKNI
jgi:hypothetical protein